MKGLLLLILSFSLFAQSFQNMGLNNYVLDEARMMLRQNRACEASQTEEPPFFVSSAYKHKVIRHLKIFEVVAIKPVNLLSLVVLS